MNEHSDIGRVLRHWFDDGPSTMPDRVVDVVADRITRERQRPAGRLPWRVQPMNPAVKIGAAVAAVLVIAIVGWNMLPGPSTGSGGPAATPTPTSSPAASAAPTPVPTAPWWVGLNRSGIRECGQAPGVPYGCAGELAAGTVTSGGLDPALTYTVPSGWVNSRDWAKYYVLFPDTPANRSAVANGGDAGIVIVIGEPTVPVANVDCSGTPQTGVGTTAAEIAAALVARDGLVTGTPKAVTLSGLTGQQLDVSLEPGWTATCPADPATPAVPLIGEVIPVVVTAEHPYRLILLDTPDGGNIAIELLANTAAAFEPSLAAAMPIVETFEFD